MSAGEDGSQSQPVASLPPLSQLNSRPSMSADETLNASMPTPIADDGHTTRDVLWTYLSSRSQADLRKICRDYGVRQQGVKEEVAARVFDFLCRDRDTDTLWDEPSSRGHSVSFDLFLQWKSQQEFRVVWSSAPDLNAGVAEAGSNGVEDSQTTSRRTRAFTVSDFCRLVVILATDDQVKKALLESGLEMSRDELDRGVTRHAFWTDLVEPAFNNTASRFSYTFEGPLASTHCLMSTADHRAGDQLRKQYGSMRSEFTKCFDKWKRSGQNNPSFELFCPNQPRSSELSTAGKKCLALFQILRCNRPDERTDLLDFTLRTIPAEAMVDTGETSITLDEARAARKKRGKRAGDELEESVVKFSALIDGQRAAQTVNVRSELLNQMRTILAMMRELSDHQDDERNLLSDELEKVKAKLRE